MVAATLNIRAREIIITRILLHRQILIAQMQTAIQNFFDQQAERIVARLLAPEKVGPSAVSLFEGEDSLLQQALGPYIERGLVSSAELAALMLGESMGQPGAAIQNLLGQAGQRIVNISETTRDAVQWQLQQAQERGYNLFQMANGVPGDDWRGIRDTVRETYRNRAEAIARTEMGEASQQASQAQWRDMGVLYQDIVDGDKDEGCANRNGTRVPIDEYVGLIHPNCTVLSLPVTGTQQEAVPELQLNESYTEMANAYNLPIEEFRQGNVPGYVLGDQSHASSIHVLAATSRQGRITVYPRFFESTLEERRIIIQHEMGHWVATDLRVNGTRDALLAPFERDGRFPVSWAADSQAHEMLADTYVALDEFTPGGLSMSEVDRPMLNLFRAVAQSAQRIGLPIPSQWVEI